MSLRLLKAVFALRPSVVKAAERSVLMCLAWHAHDDGTHAFPSVSTMARECSLTRRAVQLILPRLKSKGLIRVAGALSRGAVKYELDLTVLDCERYSQSRDCERDSQTARSAGAICEPRSSVCEPGSPPSANPVRPNCISEPSLNKSRASATPGAQKFPESQGTRTRDDQVALVGTIRMRLQLMLLEKPMDGGNELLEDLHRHVERLHGRPIDPELVGRVIDEELAARRERASTKDSGPTRLMDIAS